jgi:ketosteroid isomerase-like protein
MLMHCASPEEETVSQSATDNIDFIKGMYAAFARGDVPTVLGAMDEKIEWNEAEGNPYNVGHPFVGTSQVVEGVFARVMNDIEGFEIHPERFISQGDTVVMLGRYRGVKAHATGKSLDAQAVHVWELRDGKAVRFQQYVDTLQMSTILGSA